MFNKIHLFNYTPHISSNKIYFLPFSFLYIRVSFNITHNISGTPVAQWVKRWHIDLAVPDSRPDQP